MHYVRRPRRKRSFRAVSHFIDIIDRTNLMQRSWNSVVCSSVKLGDNWEQYRVKGSDL